MADQVPTSRKVPPLAIIVVVILAALAVVAFANRRTATPPPGGGPTMPRSQPSTPPVMPQTSTVPDAQAPASRENGAVGHEGTANAPGANASGAAR